jgi:hypothetical protein
MYTPPTLHLTIAWFCQALFRPIALDVYLNLDFGFQQILPVFVFRSQIASGCLGTLAHIKV